MSIWKQVVMRCGEGKVFFAFRDPPLLRPTHSKNVFFLPRDLCFYVSVLFFAPAVFGQFRPIFLFLRPLANQPARNRKKRGTLFLLSPLSPERLYSSISKLRFSPLSRVQSSSFLYLAFSAVIASKRKRCISVIPGELFP